MSTSTTKRSLVFLALGALGVVYGDIGTSPLYAVREIFFGHAIHHATRADVLGAISVVFWALTIIVAFKYVAFVLTADNEGEGGVFALYGLINDRKNPKHQLILWLLVIAAGLLFGDGIITPAISVVSAVEGLSVVTSTLTPYVVPITVTILTLLFLVQARGTESVGKVFGPVMLVWFAAIGALGASAIIANPEILAAINPAYAVRFLTAHPVGTMMAVLGSVMLVVTGGEAMYADLGHFGRIPIRISWFAVTYPALLLNYFGQGATMLSGQEIPQGNLFFAMVPQPLLVPMVVLATAATVIASQALISGAFSLMTQAISLELTPYLPIRHTNPHHQGQIYVPMVNWALYIGSVALVIVFQSSSRLASAYGLAVSGVMFVTTLGMIVIAREYWKLRPWAAYTLFVPLAAVDLVFLVSNSTKLFDGGYIPLSIALVFLLVVNTWLWGRGKVKRTFGEYPVMTMRELIARKDEKHVMLPRAMIVMAPTPIRSVDDPVPVLKQMFWERYGALPQHLVFLTVKTPKMPHVHERFQVTKFFDDPVRGSITAVNVSFGFMEDPNVESVLEAMAKRKDIPVDPDHTRWLIHVMHERPVPGKDLTPAQRIRYELYAAIARNAESADHYFGLGENQPLTIETLPVTIGRHG